MKKIFMILCVMVMSLAFVSLTGCGGSDSGGEAPDADSPYIGSWIATTAEFKGEEVDLAEALEEGDYIIVLNEDGTATSSYGGEEASGTWTVTDDGLKLRGDDLKMDFVAEEDGSLSCDIFGFKMFFVKQ